MGTLWSLQIRLTVAVSLEIGIQEAKLLQKFCRTSFPTLQSKLTVELPAFYNTSDMTRKASTIHYRQLTRLHTISTTITTFAAL